MAATELGNSIPIPLNEGGVDSPEIKDRDSLIYDHPIYKDIFSSWAKNLNEGRIAEGKAPVEDKFEDLKRRVDANPADSETKQIFWFLRNDAEHVFRETVESINNTNQLRQFLTNRDRLMSGKEPDPREIDAMIDKSQRVFGSMNKAINDQDKRSYSRIADDPAFEHTGYLASLHPHLKAISDEIELLRQDHRGVTASQEKLNKNYIRLRWDEFAEKFPAKASAYAKAWEEYADAHNLDPHDPATFNDLPIAEQEQYKDAWQLSSHLAELRQRHESGANKDAELERMRRASPVQQVVSEWQRIDQRVKRAHSKDQLKDIAANEGVSQKDIEQIMELDEVGMADAITRARVMAVGREARIRANDLVKLNDKMVSEADKQKAVKWLIDTVGGRDVYSERPPYETIYGIVASMTLDEIQADLDKKLWSVMGAYNLDWGSSNSSGLGEMMQALQFTPTKDQAEIQERQAKDYPALNTPAKIAQFEAEKEAELLSIQRRKNDIVVRTTAAINLHNVKRGYQRGDGSEAYNKNTQSIDYEQHRIIAQNTAGVAVAADFLKENDGAFFRKEERFTDTYLMFKNRNELAAEDPKKTDLMTVFRLLDQDDGRMVRAVDWSESDQILDFSGQAPAKTKDLTGKIWLTTKKIDMIRIKEEQDDKLIKSHKRSYINRRIENRADGVEADYREKLIEAMGENLDQVITTAVVLDYYNLEQTLTKDAEKQTDQVFVRKAINQILKTDAALPLGERRLKFLYQDHQGMERDQKDTELEIEKAISELAAMKHEADFAFVLAEDEYYVTGDGGKYDGARWNADSYIKQLNAHNEAREKKGMFKVDYIPNLVRPTGATLENKYKDEKGQEQKELIDLMEIDRAKESLEYLVLDNGRAVPETDNNGQPVYEKDRSGRTIYYLDANDKWQPKPKYKFDQAKYNRHRTFLSEKRRVRTPHITEAIDRAERAFNAKHQATDYAIEISDTPPSTLENKGKASHKGRELILPTGRASSEDAFLSGDGRQPSSPKRIQHSNYWIVRPHHTNFTDTGAPSLAPWLSSNVQSLSETTGRFDVMDQVIEWQADISPIGGFWLPRVVGGEEYRKILTDKDPYVAHSANAVRNKTVETIGKILGAKSYQSVQERQEEAAHIYEGMLLYNMWQIKKDSSRHKYMGVIEVDNVLRAAVADGQLGLGQYHELKNKLMWGIPYFMDIAVMNNKLKKLDAIESFIWDIIKAASKGLY